MHSNELIDVTTVAHQAIEKMIELAIPANPTNYMVWYHYFANSYPDLKRRIDSLLDANQEFDSAQCAEVYEKFFTLESESALLENTTGDIETVINNAVKYLDEAGTGAAEFGETLADASGGLENQASPDMARQIIAGVVQATQEMNERTKSLEERLLSSSGEIANLRREIEVTRREAATDSLTGLANRKRFDITLRDTAVESAGTDQAMCLLMLDIDFFKKFNDNYGHQTGDQVLKLLALTMKECIKGQDTAARYGGEEFCVILPNTPLQAAAHVAEVIRDRVARKSIINKSTGEKLGAITLSIGVSLYAPGEPLGELIARADAALYAAKNQGRNRVLTELDIEAAAASA